MVAGILTWIGSVAILILVQLLFIIPYTFNHFPGGTKEDLQRFLLTDKTAVFLQILSLLPAHLLTLGVVWAVITRFGKRPFWRSLGWDWGKNFGFWKSAGFAVGLFIVGSSVLYFIGTTKTSFDVSINSSRATAYLVAFIAVATAPMAEEFVYRGVLYSALHKKLGVNWAVVGVLALFTLVHVPQYWPDYGRIGLLGLLSLSLTVVRAYTGRLLPCFVLHTVFNGIQSVIIFIEPYLPKSLTGEDPHASGAVISQIIHHLF